MTKKLLFVDDEPVFEKMVKQRFKKEIQSGEYEILFAQSGETALKTIEENKDIDLLLTDLKMPAAKIQGPELIEKIHEKNINLKIIVISAYLDMSEYTNEIKKNVFISISKPFDIKNIKEIINNRQNEIQTNLPDQESINICTLSGLARKLSPKKQIQLIESIIENLDLSSLQKLEQEIPIKITKQIDFIKNNKETMEAIIAKIRRGEIDENTPLELINKHEILERYIPQDGNNYGPYYYLRWWNPEKKKLESKYLGKTDPRKLILDRNQKS